MKKHCIQIGVLSFALAVQVGSLWAVPEDGKVTERRNEWIEKAVTGDVDAMMRLGNMFQLEGDRSLALSWFRKAADKNNVSALWKLVGLYEQQPLAERATTMQGLFEELMTLGETRAYYHMGRLYLWEESPLRNENLGDMYLRQASDFGVTDAKILLGKLFLGTWGHHQDYLQSIDYFTRATKDKSPEAFRQLGTIYRYGLGNRTDLELAWRYYGQAARLGDVESMFIIAEALYEGKDIAQDKERSKKFYSQAAELGHRDAALRLKELSFSN